MPAWGELLVASACLVGIVGTVLPVLPGDLLVGGAILVWGIVERSAVSWVATSIAIALLVVGHVVTVLVPTRRMSAAGIPWHTLAFGAVVGIVGFFAVPVVGLPLGFVLGVYLAEWIRTRDHAVAWASTIEAMKGTGLAVLISFTAAVLATAVWAAVALTT